MGRDMINGEEFASQICIHLLDVFLILALLLKCQIVFSMLGPETVNETTMFNGDSKTCEPTRNC